MKKRHIALLFAFALLLTLLCACGMQVPQPESSSEEPTRSSVMQGTENPLPEKREETTITDKGEKGENGTIPVNPTPIDGEQA